MTQKEFIKRVREVTAKVDFNYWHLEHFVKVVTVTVINFGKTIEKKARSPPADIGNNCYTNGNISMWIERKRVFTPE